MNTTSDDLNLNSGSLSRSILIAAGQPIQEQLDDEYPNLIGYDTVAISGSGNLNNFKKIFHVVCPKLSDKSNCPNVKFDKQLTIFKLN